MDSFINFLSSTGVACLFNQPPVDILKTIIYEDDEIIVLNKPAGLATQGGTGITKHIDTLINIAEA